MPRKHLWERAAPFLWSCSIELRYDDHCFGYRVGWPAPAFCGRREFLVPEGEGSAGGWCLIGGNGKDAVEVFCPAVP